MSQVNRFSIYSVAREPDGRLCAYNSKGIRIGFFNTKMDSYWTPQVNNFQSVCLIASQEALDSLLENPAKEQED